MGEHYIPDAAFISAVRQPEPSHEVYNPLAPYLAVEVLSPTNDQSNMRIKIVNYLRAGIVVWLVDPELRHLEVYVPGADPLVVTEAGTVDSGAVLPGFTLAVKEVFAV